MNSSDRRNPVGGSSFAPASSHGTAAHVGVFATGAASAGGRLQKLVAFRTRSSHNAPSLRRGRIAQAWGKGKGFFTPLPLAPRSGGARGEGRRQGQDRSRQDNGMRRILLILLSCPRLPCVTRSRLWLCRRSREAWPRSFPEGDVPHAEGSAVNVAHKSHRGGRCPDTIQPKPKIPAATWRPSTSCWPYPRSEP